MLHVLEIVLCQTLLIVALISSPIMSWSQKVVIVSRQEVIGAKQEFEVASIRPMPPEPNPSHPSRPPNFPLSTENSYPTEPNDSFIADFPFTTYIQFAYKVRLTPDQLKAMIAGAPKWVNKDYYAIHAKAAGPVSKDQMRLMVQTLLTDRFKLVVHFETKEVSAVALTLIKPDKLGSGMRPHTEGPACDLSDPKVFPAQCHITLSAGGSGGWVMGARDVSIDAILKNLNLVSGLDLPLVDRTGLIGNYDLYLKWTPSSLASNAMVGSSELPSFSEVLQDQLGMKTISVRAPIQFLLIDHVERPSEN